MSKDIDYLKLEVQNQRAIAEAAVQDRYTSQDASRDGERVESQLENLQKRIIRLEMKAWPNR